MGRSSMSTLQIIISDIAAYLNFIIAGHFSHGEYFGNCQKYKPSFPKFPNASSY